MVQVIMNQLSGIIVFLLITTYLDKTSLGHINWSIALLTVVFSILGFGLEHVVIRKAATGTELGVLWQSYMGHVLIASAVFGLLVLLLLSVFPALHENSYFFIILFLSQCFSFIAAPFKNIATGLEKFKPVLIMSSSANIIKVVSLCILAIINQVGLETIVHVYLAASVAECILCVIIYRRQLNLPVIWKFDFRTYKTFIREALPQFGITVFNTALLRMDWVLLGLLSTPVMVADYSVTNKLFELSMLPLLVIAPIIFPKISRLFDRHGGEKETEKIDYLKILVRAEIIVAVYVMLVVNICWIDMVDLFTGNRYGSATSLIIFILSFAMPLLYINNVFWSILFARNQLRTILGVFFVGFLVNITIDILFIPSYHAIGAAAGFVAALTIQTLLYVSKTKIKSMNEPVLSLMPVMVSALAAGFFSKYLFQFFIWQLLAATVVYVLLLVISKQLRYTDWSMTKKILAF